MEVAARHPKFRDGISAQGLEEAHERLMTFARVEDETTE